MLYQRGDSKPDSHDNSDYHNSHTHDREQRLNHMSLHMIFYLNYSRTFVSSLSFFVLLHRIGYFQTHLNGHLLSLNINEPIVRPWVSPPTLVISSGGRRREGGGGRKRGLCFIASLSCSDSLLFCLDVPDFF